jgi:hypothetical protein
MNRKMSNSEPYEFDEDDAAFIVVGVFESEGRNRTLYPFAVLPTPTR